MLTANYRFELADSSHKSLSVGAGIALGITIPLTVGIILALVTFWYVRQRRLSPPKSPIPGYEHDEASSSWSSQIKCKWASSRAMI